MQMIFRFSKVLMFFSAFMLFSFKSFSQEDPLVYSVQQNDVEQVKHYLNRSWDPNVFDNSGYTALMYAADIGNEQIIRLLMENGANPNLNPLFDSEPPALHASVLKNMPRIADLLLLYDITNVNFEDENHKTALYYAVKFGFLECAEVLIFHGADLNKGSAQATPLQTAAYEGDTATLKMLLSKGADINKVFQNHTALSVALCRKNIEAVKILVAAGADTKLCDPLVYAAAYSDDETLKYLKDLGFDLSQREEKYGYSLKDVSTFTDNSKCRRELEKLGVKSYKPFIIKRFSFSEFNEFAKHEARVGLNFGVHENKTKTAIYLGFSFRPEYMRCLEKISDNYYYQLREKLTFFHLILEKRFPVFSGIKGEFGFNLAYQFAFCSGKFDGAVDMKPQRQNFHSPIIGMYLRGRYIGLSSGYKFYNYQNAIQPPKNIYYLSFDFYLPRRLKGYKNFKL